MKKVITDENKIRQVLHHVQTITALAQLITIEYHSALVDVKFKNPIANQKASRIHNDAKDIIKAFDNLVRVKDQEFMEYEHAVQMHRMFKFFSVMDCSQLERFMDAVEKEVPTIEGVVEYFNG